MFVDECMYMVLLGVGNNNVIVFQCIVMYQNCGDWVVIFVDLVFDNYVFCSLFRVGFQVEYFSLQCDCFGQFFQICVFECGDWNRYCFIGYGFYDNFVLQKVGQDVVWVIVWFVIFVDCNDYWCVCSFGVIDGFYGLWYDGVIGSYYQDYQVGCYCIM